MLNLPFGLGERLANQSSAITAARFDTSDEMELFTPPFALPKPLPDRHYFMFGKPIDTANIDYRNKSECDVVYKEVQAETSRLAQELLWPWPTIAVEPTPESDDARFVKSFPLELPTGTGDLRQPRMRNELNTADSVQHLLRYYTGIFWTQYVGIGFFGLSLTPLFGKAADSVQV